MRDLPEYKMCVQRMLLISNKVVIVGYDLRTLRNCLWLEATAEQHLEELVSLYTVFSSDNNNLFLVEGISTSRRY
jgi:hypothetical protein